MDWLWCLGSRGWWVDGCGIYMAEGCYYGLCGWMGGV